MARIGIYVLGLAAIATGVVNLVFGTFDPAEEPIQAWGDKLTGSGGFADAVAMLLILGGVAVMWRRSARYGAIALAIAYFIFVIFCLPRLYWGTHFHGWRGTIGAAVGVGQQLILIAAAAIVYACSALPPSSWAQRLTQAARWVFGISTICFGLGHLASVGSVAAMVPKWLPLGGDFWAIVTGIAFVLAGIAILWGTLDVLAARLLALMLLIFSAFALAPVLQHYPHSHAAWGINVYNLAAVGGAWILADWLASRRLGLRLQARHVPSGG